MYTALTTPATPTAHWILQQDLYWEQAYADLPAVLQAMGAAYSFHKIVPNTYDLDPPLPAHLLTNPIICMGSYSLRHCAAKLHLSPGVYDLEPYPFPVQLQHWGNRMLNSDSQLTTIKHATIPSKAVFVRPAQDSKSFSGMCLSPDAFKTWQQQVLTGRTNPPSLTPTTEVQIAALKTIHSEFRFWIVQGKPITASLYRRGNTVQYVEATVYSEPALWQYAVECCEQWMPLPTFCLDIANTPDGFKIIEIGTINSCGLYAANLQKLLFSLEDSLSPPNPL